MSIKSLLAALVVSLSLAGPVLAGPFEDGKTAYKRGDYTTALLLWRPLAEQGNDLAQYYLGEMYEFGKGVPQNDVMPARLVIDLITERRICDSNREGLSSFYPKNAKRRS